MWAAQLRAPPPTQCVLSSQGTLVPRGTFWCPCVPVRPSPPHCAPQSSTLPASISLVQLRAGGGKLFTLASFASVGKYRIHPVQQMHKEKRGNLGERFSCSFNMIKRLYLFISVFTSLSNPCILTSLQVSEVPLVSGFLFNWFCSSDMGVRQRLHWPTVSGHV